MHKKFIISSAVFVLILICYCATYYSSLWPTMPHGIHTWAQADRLSLAVSFYGNGMNFFKPSTHNIYSEQGITGVEFPIQAYIAALSGKVFGREYISLSFRLLNTVISCTGLLFLFLAGYKATRDFIFSLVTPLFVFSSPVFIYYTCNYLPDSAAASVSFIAFYYILCYIDTHSKKSFILGIVFLTLAALIKTSVGLYLCAFLFLSLWLYVKDNRSLPLKKQFEFYIPALLSIYIVTGYYLYNRYLNTTYNSEVFLANINPFQSFEDLSRYLNDFRHVWSKEYFILPQYILLATCIVIGIPLLFQTREGKNKLSLSVLFLFGVIAMAILMGRQLYHHDYYAVSIFIPLVTFALLISVIAIRQSISLNLLIPVRLVFLAAVLICFFFADHHIYRRMQYGVAGLNPGFPWAEKGADIFRKLQIPTNEKILVLNEDDPNTHLLFFDRKGINVLPGKWENMNTVLNTMNTYHIRTMVCNAGLGRHLQSKDTILRQHFNTLYLQDRIAVFRLK